MTRKRYSSDLTDAEWALLAPLIPAAKTGGRPRTVAMREVLNGIFYVLKTGCQWGNLPGDFPASGTVYHYFNTWRKNKVWGQLNDQLRAAVRVAVGKQATPSAGAVDSQTVKTTAKGGNAALMERNSSSDGSALSSWIRLASSSKSW
jgi:putative transposase